MKKPIIIRSVGAEHVEQAARRLDDVIRKRLIRVVHGAQSKLVELASGRSVLLTAERLEQLPGAAMLRRLTRQVYKAASDMVAGTLHRVRKGVHTLPLKAPIEGGFVASVLSEVKGASRAVLTFCFKNKHLQLIRNDALALVRRTSGVFDLVVRTKGGFRIEHRKRASTGRGSD